MKKAHLIIGMFITLCAVPLVFAKLPVVGIETVQAESPSDDARARELFAELQALLQQAKALNPSDYTAESFDRVYSSSSDTYHSNLIDTISLYGNTLAKASYTFEEEKANWDGLRIGDQPAREYEPAMWAEAMNILKQAFAGLVPVSSSSEPVPTNQTDDSILIYVRHWEYTSSGSPILKIDKRVLNKGETITVAAELPGYIFRPIGIYLESSYTYTYEKEVAANSFVEGVNFLYDKKEKQIAVFYLDFYNNLIKEKVLTIKPKETITLKAEDVEEYTLLDNTDSYVISFDDALESYTFHYIKNVPVYHSPLAMHRLYNRTTNQHFYTSNPKEVSLLQSRGWRNEGTAWHVSTAKVGTPVYRMWNVQTGERIFTRNKNEADKLATRGWKNEGIAFYTEGSGTGPGIYRLRNKKTGKYLLTINPAEVSKLVATGQWQNEGVAFHGKYFGKG